MSTHWAEFLLFIVVVAQFFCLTACIDVRLADAVRVLARPRRSGPQARGGTCRAIACRSGAVVAIGVLGFLLMLPTWWNNLAGYYVGTSVGTTGLYIAFILPGDPALAGRASASSTAPGASASTTSGSTRSRSSGSCFISIVFMLPTGPGGIPWNAGFDWNLANYAPLTIGGAFILFGGWWVLSAKNWFKGPVRMGTDEELEQLEAKQENAFLLPADTQYET